MSERTLVVDDVSHGGGLDEGRKVFFDARLDDGSEVRMVLPHTHVSAFLARIMAFAGVAQRERAEAEAGDDGDGDEDRNEQLLEQTQMLVFQQISISPLADLSGVAIQFQIQSGVAMVFPLQTRFLPQVSASLMKWHGGLQEVSAPPS
ncbi:MAG: hypothetical protein FJY55_08090 [Betaproteobacteria bacterium]|nr:hypothetical protein [Betaproteobacteria bacterium]